MDSDLLHSSAMLLQAAPPCSAGWLMKVLQPPAYGCRRKYWQASCMLLWKLAQGAALRAGQAARRMQHQHHLEHLHAEFEPESSTYGVHRPAHGRQMSAFGRGRTARRQPFQALRCALARQLDACSINTIWSTCMQSLSLNAAHMVCAGQPVGGR